MVSLKNSLSKDSTNINTLEKSKIQAIDEIKRVYENVINKAISNNSVYYQALSSNSALASIFAKRNKLISAPIYDEFTHYLNKNVLLALEELDPFKW
ncbi:hypothetical protein F8M41_000573 [Gigaspora margarita]|uniref:Uncharacterized protein n=1 Tax=Gigaspora margarita TaxID=4874 RepID=A0A8H3XHH1_GIGMA|nr:hypothetical protein F8M41_000573 [Gigaspora margarita]